MSILSEKLLIAAVLAFLSTIAIAHSDGIFNPTGNSVGNLEGIDSNGAGAPAPTGKILLVDAASFLLQVDAVSKICRAGGC